MDPHWWQRLNHPKPCGTVNGHFLLSDLLGVYAAMWGLVWWTNALNKTISPGSLGFLSCVKFIVAMLFSTAYFKFAVCLE